MVVDLSKGFGLKGEQRKLTGTRLSAGGDTYFAPSEEPGLGLKVAGGALTGLRKHPLVGPVVNRLAEQFPGVDRGTLDRLEDRLSDSNVSNVFEIVGEFGPDFLLGGGAFVLGRAGARVALGRASPAIGQFLAQRAGQAAVQAPKLLRAGEIAGGSVGVGGFDAARTAATGAPVPEIVRNAAIGAALTTGFEVGLMGLGRVLRARTAKPGGAQAAELFERGADKLIEAEGKFTGRIERLSSRMERLTERRTQQISLVRAFEQDPALGVSLGLGDEALDVTRKAIAASDKRLRLAGLQKTRLEAGRRTLQEFRQGFDPASALYTRDVPFSPTAMGEVITKLALQTVQTPESLRGQLGPTFGRFFRQWEDAESLTIIARSANEAKLTQLRDTLRQSMGFSGRELKKNRAAFIPVFEAFEKRGVEGVRGFMLQRGARPEQVRQATDVFESIKRELTVYDKLVAVGAEPALTGEDLLSLGLREYFPHTLADLPQAEIAEALSKRLGEAATSRILSTTFREGLGKFGSIDFQRSIKGSLSEKLAHGLPFERDPFEGLFKYLNATHRRLAYGQRFGFNGELKAPMRDAMIAEGANRGIVNTTMDLALGHKLYDQSMRQMANIVTGLQTGTKMALGVIPNLSQSANNLLWAGMKQNLRGLGAAVRGGESRDAIMASVALLESVVRGPGHAFGESTINPALGRFAGAANTSRVFGSGVLRWSGFQMVERWNRLMAGYTGLFTFRDTLSKALGRNLIVHGDGSLALGGTRGALRGRSLERARRQMEQIGVNLDDIVRGVQDGGDGFLRSDAFLQRERLATFRAAQLTQFIPSQTRRPILWNHPVGRVMTQFKTFALNQGRFLRDRVVAEGAAGNLAPAAYFLSLYPVAGEIVGDVRSVIKMEPRESNGLQRVIEDYSNVGGIGIVGDTFVATRYGRLMETLAGPTVGSATSFAENLTQADAQGVISDFTRQPLYKAMRFALGVGVLAGQQIEIEFPNWDNDTDTTEARTVIDLGAMRTRNKRTP